MEGHSPRDDPVSIARSDPLVDSASLLPTANIPIQEWVRDACGGCKYHGSSWSCPPGVPGLPEIREKLSGYSRALFLRFKSSGDRSALEKSVLSIESSLKGAGFTRALGFFTSPCTACPSCSYPKPCPRPGSCRPTGESWGIDLMVASQRAGLPIEIVKAGEEFKPVTLVLLE